MSDQGDVGCVFWGGKAMGYPRWINTDAWTKDEGGERAEKWGRRDLNCKSVSTVELNSALAGFGQGL